MTANLTAREVAKFLNLEPNATCGSARVTYTSRLTAAEGALAAPFSQSRPAGSALYFLVTPHAPVRPHRIKNDQLYHYYLGDPLEVFLLHADRRAERVVVGPDLAAGQSVQLFIPGGTFHTARLLDHAAFGRNRPNADYVIDSKRLERALSAGGWFLGGSTEWPGVIPADVEIGDVDRLAALHPEAADEIRAIAASAPQTV